MKKALNEEKLKIFSMMEKIDKTFKSKLKEQTEDMSELQSRGTLIGPSSGDPERKIEDKEQISNVEHAIRQLSYSITDTEQLRSIVNKIVDELSSATEEESFDSPELQYRDTGGTEGG
jgi:hypothetical protein